MHLASHHSKGDQAGGAERVALRMKTILKSMLRRFGFDLVRFPPPQPLHVHLKQFLENQGFTLVLDVGAFTGLFCQTLREDVGYTGRIASFEPCSNTFDSLAKNMTADR